MSDKGYSPWDPMLPARAQFALTQMGEPPLIEAMGLVSVKSFAAKGDGVTDDYYPIDLARQEVTKNGGTLFFPAGTYIIGTSIAFDSDITCWFAPGAMLEPTGSITITFNGPINAGRHRIFKGTGSTGYGIRFNRPSDRLFFEWWGAVADNNGAIVAGAGFGTDNYEFIQSAIEDAKLSDANVTGLTFLLPALGFFRVTAGAISLPRQQVVNIDGQGRYCGFTQTGTGLDCIRWPTNSNTQVSFQRLTNFKIHLGTGTAAGIYMTNASPSGNGYRWCELRNLWVQGTDSVGQYGLRTEGVTNSIFELIICVDCEYGFYQSTSGIRNTGNTFKLCIGNNSVTANWYFDGSRASTFERCRSEGNLPRGFHLVENRAHTFLLCSVEDDQSVAGFHIDGCYRMYFYGTAIGTNASATGVGFDIDGSDLLSFFGGHVGQQTSGTSINIDSASRGIWFIGMPIRQDVSSIVNAGTEVTFWMGLDSGSETGANAARMLQLGTGIGRAVVTKTANYTATPSDGVILVDATAGPVTITLPSDAAAFAKGLWITVKKTDSSAFAVTVQRGGGDTIEGATSFVLAAENDSRSIYKDAGTTWYYDRSLFEGVVELVQRQGSVTIAADRGMYIPSRYEVPNSYSLEVASGGVMEVGG